ncbi:MAG: dephospho-CoA kinase [Candidatus Sedimenticola sp. (ex Thyasira tokunagai)]
MFVIGVTGGIGCGKSSVTDCFTELGVPVIDADQTSREVVEPGEPALEEIVRLFGTETLKADGSLDRRYLREKIFQDSSSRKRLEELLHPIIRQRMQLQLSELTADYAIFSIPLLVETGGNNSVDRILVVDCPTPLQIERIVHRDGITPAQAEGILNAQCNREERLAVADDIIDNSGTIGQLHILVEQLHKKYTQMART